jgi:hypothetical protein
MDSIRRMVSCLVGSTLAAVEAKILEGGFLEAASIVRAADLPGRRVLLACGIHPDELGPFFLHVIETSSGHFHL